MQKSLFLHTNAQCFQNTPNYYGNKKSRMATAFLDHPIIVVAPFLIYFTEVKDIIFIGSFVTLRKRNAPYMTTFKWNCIPSHRIYFIASPLLSKSILELMEDYEAKHQLLWTMHSRVPQAFPLNLVLLFHELRMVHQSVDFQQIQPSN